MVEVSARSLRRALVADRVRVVVAHQGDASRNLHARLAELPRDRAVRGADLGVADASKVRRLAKSAGRLVQANW